MYHAIIRNLVLVPMLILAVLFAAVIIGTFISAVLYPLADYNFIVEY